MKMKRWMMSAAVLTLLVGVGVTGAAASGMGCGHGWGCEIGICGVSYVNTTNGVCDNCGGGHGSGTCGAYYVDANGDGVCDNCGGSHESGACGAYYVDANGDGVCDRRAEGGHHGAGHGCGSRSGCKG